MPMFEGTGVTHTYYTCEAIDAEQAREFIMEMVQEDVANANLYSAQDVQEVK
jgi:hypothetical protein